MIFQYLETHNLPAQPVLLSTASGLLTLALLLCTPLIPLPSHPNIYIPTALDYFRVLLISIITSLFLNFSFMFISRLASFTKVWVEFLALVLLALPQKSEIERGHKGWNLTRREAWLFGVGVFCGHLACYLWEIWCFDRDSTLEKKNKEQQKGRVNGSGDDYDLFHQYVNMQSTLANCIEVRKKTKSLKKNVYSNVPLLGADLESQQADINVRTGSETGVVPDTSITPLSVAAAVSYGLHLEPSNSPPSILRLRDLNNADSVADYASVSDRCMLYSLILTVVDASTTSTTIATYHTLMIILMSLMECGLSLILSICFIYVPGLDDSLFTKWEVFFYDKVRFFFTVVISSLALLEAIVITGLYIPGCFSFEYGVDLRKIVGVSLVCLSVFVSGLKLT